MKCERAHLAGFGRLDVLLDAVGVTNSAEVVSGEPLEIQADSGDMVP